MEQITSSQFKYLLKNGYLKTKTKKWEAQRFVVMNKSAPSRKKSYCIEKSIYDKYIRDKKIP